MKVILKAEVDNLGLPGDVVQVAPGYGRNYLVPRGLAILATRGALKEAETLTRARKAREARTRDGAEAFREALEARRLRLAVRVDEKGHLYGSVGPSEIQAALKERGHDIERRRIDLKRPLKEIGEYTVTVHLHPDVAAQLPIEVVDVEGRVTRAGPEQADTLEERALQAAEAVEEADRPGEEASS